MCRAGISDLEPSKFSDWCNSTKTDRKSQYKLNIVNSEVSFLLCKLIMYLTVVRKY